jgi:hypothetical protein
MSDIFQLPKTCGKHMSNSLVSSYIIVLLT